LAIYILAHKNPEVMFKIVSKLTNEEYKLLRNGLKENKASSEMEILNAFRGITADEIKRAESSDILHSEYFRAKYFRAKVEAAIERVPILFESNPLYVSPIEAAIAEELISEFRNPNMRPWEIIAELSLLPNACGVRITAVDQIVERWHYSRSWTKSVINKTKTLLMVDNSLLNL